MTCAEARHVILIADPSALRDRTDPVLRAHLDSCAECAAAANHVIADLDCLRTALIARGARPVVARRPQRSKRRVAMTVVPIALAAELAFFAFLGNRDAATMIEQAPVIDDSVTTMLTGVRSGTATSVAMPGVIPVVPAKPTGIAAAVTHDSATWRDTAASAELDTMAATLRVMPHARQQFAVIATSDPRVTVVWLTKGDTL